LKKILPLYIDEIGFAMLKLMSFLLVCFSFMAALQLYSQDESYLGISVGTAFPQGQFSEKNFSNPEAGYANNGFIVTFDGAIFPDYYLGIGATISYVSNSPDKNLYKADLISDVMERYPELADFEDNMVFDFGAWRYLNFHVGPTVTIAAGQFNFDVRALAGLSMVWPPNLDLQINSQEDEIFSSKTNPGAISTIGFTIGGGIRYAMKSGYVIRINSDYTNCKPAIEIFENVMESFQTGQEMESRKIEKPIKNIQLGIGIAYNFKI
jgi:hypothetical protein